MNQGYQHNVHAVTWVVNIPEITRDLDMAGIRKLEVHDRIEPYL